MRVPFTLACMQWSHWMLKDDDLGTAVTRTEHKNDSAVEIGPGGRVAKFEFVGLWGRNPMGTMVTIKFGTGGRAPSSIGAREIGVSITGSPVMITVGGNGGGD